MVQQNMNVGPYGPFDDADVFDFSMVGADGQPNQVDDPDDECECVYVPPPNDELHPGRYSEDNGVIVHVEGADASGQIFLLGVNEAGADDFLFL